MEKLHESEFLTSRFSTIEIAIIYRGITLSTETLFGMKILNSNQMQFCMNFFNPHCRRFR